MSVTRAPTGQDLICLVCGKQAQDIDHVVNRGMGGSKKRDVLENKVPLCRPCHRLKTDERIETGIYTDDGGGLYYHWRRKGLDTPWIYTPVEISQRYKCLVKSEQGHLVPEEPVLSDGAEGRGRGSDSAELSIPNAESSAPSLNAGEKEEGDGERRASDGGNGGRVDGGSGVRGENLGADSVPLPPLTHEQRVARAQEIKDAEWNRQWIAGDTGNAWIAELGESAEQYLDDFGYVHESLANILRVCAAIPKALRSSSLRFSHHVVVADLNLEDMDEWLGTCEIEQWSVAEFRRRVKGTKPKVKRYSLEELRKEVKRWLGDYAATEEQLHGVDLFLDWLGEQG